MDFLEGTTSISDCDAQPIADDGTATCTLSFDTVGDPELDAVYAGNSSFEPSDAATSGYPPPGDLDQQVQQAATTVTVTRPPTPPRSARR